MNIYENNKQLLTEMGGDSYNLATDFEVRKAILDLLGGDSSNCNSIYEVDLQILNIYLEGGGGTGGDITLSPITITENGVYTAGVGNGYNKVTVNVEIPECPEIPLTAITINSNGTYIPEEGGYNEVIVDVAGGGVGAVGEKLKLKSVVVGPDCIENGEWAGLDNFYDYIDKNYINSMHQMFADTPIARLDASKLYISNVYDTSDMFYNCFNLQQLDVSGWNTSKVTNMEHMFFNCKSLTQLDLTNWDVSKCTLFWGMFSGCYNLQSVGDLSGWGEVKVREINDIFTNCSSLTQLDLTNWDVSEASSCAFMFFGCSSLQSVGDLSGWNTENFSDFTAVFSGCSSLTQLDVTNWVINRAEYMHEMFRDCSSLTQLDLTNWTAGSLYSLDYFSLNSGIINYVGGRTIDDVIANNICIFNGLYNSASYVMSDLADRASLRALINGLAGVDPEVDGEKSLGLSAANLETMTEEDIAIGTERGWSIYSVN